MVYIESLGVGYEPSATPKLYNDSTNDQDMPLGVTNFTLTVNRRGKIAGFLAFCVVKSDNDLGYLDVGVYRNEQFISGTTFVTNTFVGAPGLIYSETLGMLSGAEVYANDIFTLRITAVDNAAIRVDAAITLVVQEY